MRRTLACLASAICLPTAAFAGPCATATARCTEWVALGTGSARSLIYRTHPLRARNPAIVRALVIVHDTDRDARGAFDVALESMSTTGEDLSETTLVIAPRFSSNDGRLCGDTLRPHEVNWPCAGDSWRSGGVAAGGRSSFDLMDDILRRAADPRVFPNLRSIVVAGHSAGGQFVTRYAMANRVHERLAVPVSYVVANPSSYAYPDDRRPLTLERRMTFRSFAGAGSCTSFDTWPYGLEDRTGYLRRMRSDVLRRQAANRPTTYLLGGQDVLEDEHFDGSCAAMAQGATRLERGQVFSAYLNQQFGARQAAVIIPPCGHDARCVFTAAASLPALFPDRRQSFARAAN